MAQPHPFMLDCPIRRSRSQSVLAWRRCVSSLVICRRINSHPGVLFSLVGSVVTARGSVLPDASQAGYLVSGGSGLWPSWYGARQLEPSATMQHAAFTAV